METHEVAKLSGVSVRALRHYDSVGLLRPSRRAENGYRDYSDRDLDRLQQILLFRACGFSLKNIRTLLDDPSFDRRQAFLLQKKLLKREREHVDAMLRTLEKSIRSMKGEISMSSAEKFEGFKEKLISDNEQEYGEEIREKYGNETVNRSNAKLKNMTKEQYAELETLTQELHDTLKAAFEQGDPRSELAQKACALHKKWLCFYWDRYSREAHRGVAQMYVDDPRFTAYYDKIAPGCAVFLRNAVRIFCS